MFALLDRQLLVLHMVRERLPIEGVVPRLGGVCEAWRPAWVGVEAVGFQLAIAREARAKLKAPVRPLTPGPKSKGARAQPAVIRAEQGQIYLPRSAPWVQAFLAEVLAFTGQGDAHDDQVDVLSYAVAEMERSAPSGGKPVVIGQRRGTW